MRKFHGAALKTVMIGAAAAAAMVASAESAAAAAWVDTHHVFVAFYPGDMSGWDKCNTYGRHEVSVGNALNYYCKYVGSDNQGNAAYDLNEFVD